MPERQCTSYMKHYSAILALTCLTYITQFDALAKIGCSMHKLGHACDQQLIKDLKLAKRTDNDHLDTSCYCTVTAEARMLLRAFIKTVLFVVVDALLNGRTT